MADLPVIRKGSSEESGGCGESGGGCGTSCGNGLEKIYPSAAVRYGAMNEIGEFTYRPGQVFACGGKVVISTERGVELGEQVSLTCGGCSKSVTREQIKRYVDNCGPKFYKMRAGRILREATEQDLLEHKKLNETLMEDIERASLLAAQMTLDMKIVTVEHLLGGERIVFYFCSEGRVDFRDMVKELARHYHTRIQMQQVGARDEARLVADYEICGRECCCKNFLKELRPVNMKMAKLQKSTLDPTKVSGRCGRLRCCLRYEHEGYELLDQKLPRVNSWVEIESGIAQVVDRQILTQLLRVRGTDGREVVVPIEDVRATNVAPPPMTEPGLDNPRYSRRGEAPRGRDERGDRPPRGEGRGPREAGEVREGRPMREPNSPNPPISREERVPERRDDKAGKSPQDPAITASPDRENAEPANPPHDAADCGPGTAAESQSAEGTGNDNSTDSPDVRDSHPDGFDARSGNPGAQSGNPQRRRRRNRRFRPRGPGDAHG